MEIKKGQKYKVVRRISCFKFKVDEIFEYGCDYSDRRMLQFYINSGLIKLVEDEPTNTEVVEEHPRKKSTKRPIENDDLVDAMPN